MNTQPKALRLADILQHKLPSVECLENAAAELRRLHDLLGKANALCRIREERIKEMEAENEALRADAERYRWLRDMDHWPAAFDSHTAPEPVRGAELDAAIDAARGEK